VAGLERERAARQQRLAGEFDLPPGQVANPNTLKQSLLAQVDALESAVAQTEQDLERVQEPAGLKRWLNQQREQSSSSVRARSDRDLDDYFN
jgi:multidrug efflux pump subunit AcrA (membrane-fusion protein)